MDAALDHGASVPFTAGLRFERRAPDNGGSSPRGCRHHYNGFTGWNQQVRYSIFSDAGNQPGKMMAGGIGQNVTAAQSAFNWCCGGKAWLVEFDLASDFVAAAGATYWLELTGAGGPDPWWVSANAGNGVVGKPGQWSSVGLNFAFTLSTPTDSGVPEPTSLLLAGGALAALAWARRKA